MWRNVAPSAAETAQPRARLSLWRDGAAYRSYHIALGRQPVGQQRASGDGRTPEGAYVISGRDPHSFQYKALRLSDPSGHGRMHAGRQVRFPLNLALPLDQEYPLRPVIIRDPTSERCHQITR